MRGFLDFDVGSRRSRWLGEADLLVDGCAKRHNILFRKLSWLKSGPIHFSLTNLPLLAYAFPKLSFCETRGKSTDDES